MTLTRRRLFGLLPIGLVGLLPRTAPTEDALHLERLIKGDPFTVWTEIFVKDATREAYVHHELRWAIIDTADSLGYRGMHVTQAWWHHWSRTSLVGATRGTAPYGTGWYTLLQAVGKLGDVPRAENSVALGGYATIAEGMARLARARLREGQEQPRETE